MSSAANQEPPPKDALAFDENVGDLEFDVIVKPGLLGFPSSCEGRFASIHEEDARSWVVACGSGDEDRVAVTANDNHLSYRTTWTVTGDGGYEPY